MTDVEDLSRQFDEHEEKDEERFLAVGEKIDDLGGVIRSEVGRVVEAISGNALVGGLRERVGKLEDAERDRKWALRILWAAVIVEAVALVFRVFTVSRAP